MKEVRTRFAPSPTGYMHIGNLRSTLFEYLVAKNNNGKFILRIEDTDQSRKVDGAVDFIYNTLSLCGFKIDEGPLEGGKYGPYIQSERLDLYKKYAHKLVEMGKAYYCFCTPDRLNSLREHYEKKKMAFMYDKRCYKLSKEEIEEKLKNGESYVIRQDVPNEGVSVYEDLVYGKIEIENKFIEDQILLKSDGYPTYNFANVIDDHLMNITHVVRGNEYLSSTPKYNMLYDAYGWEKPVYIHLPHVNGEDGKKLSKRNGDASFMDLYNKGYLPEAIINYLALLGWSSSDNKEIFTLDELVEAFSVSRINNSGATFDIKKLNWVNSHYIKKMTLEDLKELTYKHLNSNYDLSNKSNEWILSLIGLYQKEIDFGFDIVSKVKLFFDNDFSLNDEELSILNEEECKKVLKVFKKEIENISVYNCENIKIAINNTKEITNVKGKFLFMPIRIKCSGKMHGPDLINTLFLIGKDVILERLEK